VVSTIGVARGQIVCDQLLPRSVLSGLNARFADDTDTRTGICYADYTGNGARIREAPLIHPVGLGVSQAQVTGLVRMFLVGPLFANSDLLVEFIGGPTPVGSVSWGRTKIRYH
jgi:hypothetical protein